MEDLNQIERMERYLRNQMDNREKKVFEAELGTESKLAEEFKKYQLAKLAVETYRHDQIKAEFLQKGQKALKRLRKGKKPFPVKNRNYPLRLLAWAAMITLVMIIGYAQVRYSNKAIAKRYYISTVDITIAGPLSNGYIAFFIDKDYSKAIERFSKIQPGSQEYDEAQYYIAHSHFQLANYVEAQSLFENLINTNSIPGKTDVKRLKWNRMITRLIIEKDQQAIIEALEKEQPQFTGTESLKKELNSFWRKLVWI